MYYWYAMLLLMVESNSEGEITIMCQCMLFMVRRGVVCIIIVVELICRTCIIFSRCGKRHVL